MHDVFENLEVYKCMGIETTNDKNDHEFKRVNGIECMRGSEWGNRSG